MYLDRIGMENEPPNQLELDREFDLNRIQVRWIMKKLEKSLIYFKNPLNSGRRSNQQQLMLSNYSYDPRLHLQTLDGQSKNCSHS